MPAVGPWLAAVWTAGGIGATILKTAAFMALNFAVAKVTAPKGPRAKDIQTELRDASAQRTRHLGRVRASGVVMFWDWVRVDGQRRLFKLLAVGQGGISGVEKVWLNDKLISRSGDAVTTKPWDGKVSIRWRTGFDGELSGGSFASLISAFSNWTAAHRLHGVGTVLGEFDAVKGEDIAEVYSGGDPAISLLIRGDRCYRPGDATYAWSDNLAIQMRDIFTHPLYGPLSFDDIDNASFIQAQLDCDDALPKKGGGTVSRYTGGGSYTLSEPVVDVARRISDASAGQVYITTEGKVGFRVGKWRAPNYTIRETHIVSLEIGPGSGEFERVTTLVPKYVAPEIDWQETTADAWEDTAAIALYGESAEKELDVPWVQSHAQARRLAKIKLAKLNPAWRATVKLRFWGLLLLEEETVRLHLPELGLGNAPAWIDGFAFDADGDEGVVTVDLLSADPSSFNWTGAEEGEPPSVPSAISHEAPLLSAPVISSLVVAVDDGPPYILVTVDDTSGPYYLGGQYWREGSPQRFDLDVQQTPSNGKIVARSLPNADRGQYNIQLAWYTTRRAGPTTLALDKRASEYATVTGIEIFANTVPPDAPLILSQSGTAGGSFTIIFAPDLGANYYRTAVWRGAPGVSFAEAVFMRWNYDTSSEVALTGSVPVAGARYWLQSENRSGKTSAAVLVGQYIP